MGLFFDISGTFLSQTGTGIGLKNVDIKRCKWYNNSKMNYMRYDKLTNLLTELTPEEQHRKNLEQLANYCPLDDDFMRELFRNNLELAEYILRIIISKPDLKLIKEETQYDLQNLLGERSICLDVFGSTVTISFTVSKCSATTRVPTSQSKIPFKCHGC